MGTDPLDRELAEEENRRLQTYCSFLLGARFTAREGGFSG